MRVNVWLEEYLHQRGMLPRVCMNKSDYALRKIMKVTFKASSFKIQIFLQLHWQMSVLILQFQLQSILEWTQHFFTTDQIMRVANIFMAIVHTHFRPYLHT